MRPVISAVMIVLGGSVCAALGGPIAGDAPARLLKEVPREQVEALAASIDGRTLIVDWHDTWDYATIQAALNAAESGDTIIVLPSTGSPGGAYVENITVPGIPLTLRSINPEDPAVVAATVIDGNQTGSVVTFAEGASTETRLDGFTIRNGTGTVSGGYYYGGGVYCHASSPTITKCTITGNNATSGGGIACIASSPTIVDCTIAGNGASSGGGGGVYCHSSSPTINNCTVTDNSGSGVYCYSSSAMIANCTIAGNSGWSSGGGVYCNHSSLTIANCTIADNDASDGGGINCYYSSPTIANTIVAFNSSGIYRLGSDMPSLRHNCVYGNTAYNYSGMSAGVGDISLYPRFMNLAAGNYGLSPGSPCIDAANNADVPADSADLDGDGDTVEPLPLDLAGRARFVDDPWTPDTGAGTPPIVDIGAYEFFVTARADFDADGDVDVDDLAVFEACATGPAIPYNAAGLPEPEPGCTLMPDGNGHIAADLDIDRDVDQGDFGLFQRCYSGEGNPADPECAGGIPLSSLQSAAEAAARAGVAGFDSSGPGWALALQTAIDVLAAHDAPNLPEMNTSLLVNPALVEVLADVNTPDNAWDKVLTWDYATSGRTGMDADKNLVVRIQRGRCYRDDAGNMVFESLEHDAAANTGWVTANPNIPPFMAANAVLVELERPEPPGSGTTSVNATALAMAGPVDEVMVAPFAIPVCSLLDEYGEFQGQRMSVTDRIFTEAARYCEGEGPNCNNMPTFPYTPCSEVYKDLDDAYLWEEGDEQLRGGQFGNDYFRNFFTGTFDDPNAPGYFAYHRMMMGPYSRGEGAYPLHHDDEVYDDSLGGLLPLAGWFPPDTIEEPYGEYSDGLFGKTEVMASDHAALVGLPAGSAGGGVDQAAVLNILGDGGPGTVAARIGEAFHPLESGLTSGEDDVWNRIVGAFGPGAQASNPAYASTELGTIENNYVELTVRSYSAQQLWGHARTHAGIDADRDGAISGPPDQPVNDWASGRYIWDRGLCSSRRVKLQCATAGVDHMCSPSGARADVAYGQSAPDTGDLIQWWYDNELAGYWVDIDGDGIESPDVAERLAIWWDLEPTNQCPECVQPDCWDFDDPECYDEWMSYFECLDACVPADPHLDDKINYVDEIKTFWDSKGVLGRLFAVPADGVDDDTPVWRVKVPVIGVRGPAGTCCQDVDGAFDADPGPMSDWDPVVNPSAAWEIIGFVDMLIYDVAIRDMSDWLPPFEQKTHFGKLPVSGAIIGKDDGTGRTYGPGAFYFIRGTDSAGNPVQGREARVASLDLSESNQHIRSANLVRGRITTATDFIPTSANEGPRASQLVRSWERR